jgi:hypothetical protein
VDAVASIEQPLAAAIADRTGSTDDFATTVLAAAVSAAGRVAVRRWVLPAGERTGTDVLVVPRGSLADLLREALAHEAPALAAFEAGLR